MGLVACVTRQSKISAGRKSNNSPFHFSTKEVKDEKAEAAAAERAMAGAITLSSGFSGCGGWRGNPSETSSIPPSSSAIATSIAQVSNYDIFLPTDCLAYSKIKPSVNQIERHPYFQRDSLVKFCQKHGICVTAHTPLGGAAANAEWFGTVSCLGDPVIQELARKYNKTVAQLVLRWGIQRNAVVVPKTSKMERLQENLLVSDFTISDEDMDKIKGIDQKYRTNQPARFWGMDLYA